jgi:EF-P beta-lysylation protein EpmB
MPAPINSQTSTQADVKTIDIQPDWKTEFSRCINSTDELLNYLQLDPQQLSVSQQAALSFPMQVPWPFVRRMEVGNPDDPLLSQVLPIDAEMQTMPGFSPDPLKEADHNPVPGIVHKYRNRLLLIVSPHCAINCRYCFRRHFPYEENRQSKEQWQQALAYISSMPEINEVIFSGGDPLAANDKFLGWLTEQIANIPHIKRLRIHSRLPVVIPSRINQQFFGWATTTRLKPVMVLHINHGNEINDELAASIAQCSANGILMLNQTVLLKGINDDAEILSALSEKLFDCGVTPYYLHLLDQVQGASHFDVGRDKAKQIYAQLQARLPGFLVPKLVTEIAGKRSKTQIISVGE